MSMREKPDKFVQEVLDRATMDVDDALEAVRAVERGEAPSGSAIIALTGPRSLSSPGPGEQGRTCTYCHEAPADPGYDRCGPCRTWRDEAWCEANNHTHGEPIEDDDGTRITILITHDENSLYATLHSSRDSAMEELRGYLNDNPVDYQDPLPEDASHEKITHAADDRSQFSWQMLEQKVPGDVL